MALDIPVYDPRPQITGLRQEIDTAINSVLKSGQFIIGPNVKAFETEVAAYLGAKYAIGVNSGTDALVIALRALGIGPGDEVITTPFTFFATAEAISTVGAIPVFADIDPRTFNIDPLQVKAKLTNKTKAILPVHIFGRAADLVQLQQIANQYNLYIIEDVAQAFGGSLQNRKLGTGSQFGCYSFFPTKNLSCFGDGGLLVTNDENLADHAKMLRAHGSRKKYYNEEIGYNSRLDEIQAAVLRVKLPYLDQWNLARYQAAENYAQMLQGVKGIEVLSLPLFPEHVVHQYTIRVKDGNRDKLKEELEKMGIGSMIYYPVPVNRLPVYKDLKCNCPHAEAAAAEVISLPMWPEIEVSIQEIVVGAIRKVLES